MCRLTVYKGKPILIGTVVTKPNNSLLYQSRDATYHPGVKDDQHRRNIVVNGDGFGLAWYSSQTTEKAAVEAGACCLKFDTPAWNNPNLYNIGDHLRSSLIFAHIRAASSGHFPFQKVSINHDNCHPFTYGMFTFMHNGGIPYFNKIKLRLLSLLSEKFFQEIRGCTDSEHIFALFLTILFGKCGEGKDLLMKNHTVEDMIEALNQTIVTVIYLCETAQIEDACSMNFCVTDGINIIATRFRSGSEIPPSLYFNYGSDFVCEDGIFYSKPGEKKSAKDIVISSAPLSKMSELDSFYSESIDSSDMLSNESIPVGGLLTEEDCGCWILMPKDYMLVCRGDITNPDEVASIELEPVRLSSEVFLGAQGSMLSNSNVRKRLTISVQNLDIMKEDNPNNYVPFSSPKATAVAISTPVYISNLSSTLLSPCSKTQRTELFHSNT